MVVGAVEWRYTVADGTVSYPTRPLLRPTSPQGGDEELGTSWRVSVLVGTAERRCTVADGTVCCPTRPRLRPTSPQRGHEEVVTSWRV